MILMGAIGRAAKRIFESMKYLYAGYYHYDIIKATLKCEKIFQEQIIVYSYWMNSTAFAVTKLQKEGCITAYRVHGADLYADTT